MRRRRYEVTEINALIEISNQMLEDSAFDMEGEIRGEATEQFAVEQGAEIRFASASIIQSGVGSARVPQ